MRKFFVRENSNSLFNPHSSKPYDSVRVIRDLNFVEVLIPSPGLEFLGGKLGIPYLALHS